MFKLTLGVQDARLATIPQKDLSSVLVSGRFRFWKASIRPFLGKIFTTCSPLTNSAFKVAPANSTCSEILNLSVLSFKFFYKTARNYKHVFPGPPNFRRRRQDHPCSSQHVYPACSSRQLLPMLKMSDAEDTPCANTFILNRPAGVAITSKLEDSSVMGI